MKTTLARDREKTVLIILSKKRQVISRVELFQILICNGTPVPITSLWCILQDLSKKRRIKKSYIKSHGTRAVFYSMTKGQKNRRRKK